MRHFILSRYILREHIGPFCLSFSVITLIFLLDLLFRHLSRILSKGLPWMVVVEFFTLNLAWIVATAVPMAVLTATLMAFGRLAADHEITAMQASGVSLWRQVAPVFIAATALAIGLIWFNNNVLPDFNYRARLLTTDIARKKPGVNIEPGVWYGDIPHFGLLAQALDDSAGITKALELLIDDNTQPEWRRTIAARSGLIQLSPRDGALLLTLFDGEIQEINLEKIEEFRRLTFSKHLMAISVEDMFLHRSESELRNDREKSTQQMWQEVQASRTEMAMLAQQLDLAEQLEEMQHYERTIKSLLVEIHKKYAIPIASLVFILIGAPLGVLARRGGFAAGVALSLGFFLFYWALFIGGEDLADRQMVSPFLAMWSANFITGALGVYVFWYVAAGNLTPASLTFKGLLGRLFFREFFLRNTKIRRDQGGVDSNQDWRKRTSAEMAPTHVTATLTTLRLDLPAVLEILRHLVHRTHADFALLCDRNGVPLAHYGNPTTVETANGETQSPSIADFDKIAVPAAKQIAATQEIARSIGDDGRFNSILYEGECRNNFIYQIGDDFILTILIEKAVALGLVRLHANQAVASLQKVL